MSNESECKFQSCTGECPQYLWPLLSAASVFLNHSLPRTGLQGTSGARGRVGHVSGARGPAGDPESATKNLWDLK